MAIHIIGAGLAGLLAAEMLRGDRPVVFEQQSALPDNHGALLRFRSDLVARETKQTFKRVRVFKAVKRRKRVHTMATLQDANQYALKVSGEARARSILDLATCERYMAPDTFIAALAANKDLRFGTALSISALQDLRHQRDIVTISTIPMPVLMRMVGWPEYRPADFTRRIVYSATCTLAELPVDVYQTIYYPEPDFPAYRASISGNRLIVEYATDVPPDLGVLPTIMADFGLPQLQRGHTDLRTKKHEYGKLVPPVDDRGCKSFITFMTDEYNVYSVGRFATWRQLLLDDVVNDVHKVQAMMAARSSYDRRLKST